jgi:hypothetical protein
MSSRSNHAAGDVVLHRSPGAGQTQHHVVLTGEIASSFCVRMSIIIGKQAYGNRPDNEGGDHFSSVATVMREKSRGEQAFIYEQDRKPGSAWYWLHIKRDAIHQILSFCIGEAPVDPFGQLPASCTVALATGAPRPPVIRSWVGAEARLWRMTTVALR